MRRVRGRWLGSLAREAVAAQQRPETAARNARAIKGDLKTLATDPTLAQNAGVAKLQRRILRHLPELVTFITNPALEGTNNRAEREFRPHAIGRHRSGGARSDDGAQTYATNLSVVRTVQRHGGDFLDTFRQSIETLDWMGPLTRQEALRKLADLKKNVMLVGQGSHFEIWGVEAWEAKLARAMSLAGSTPPPGAENFSL